MEGFQRIFHKLEKIEQKNCRTVIFYENIYPAIAMLKRIFSEREGAHLLLFSNNTLRQLKIICEYLNIDLSTSNIILLNSEGISDEASRVFGYDDMDNFLDYIETLEGTLVMICRSHLKMVSGDYPGIIFEILERAKDTLQIYALTNLNCHTEIEREMVASLFDVSIILKKQDEYFGFGEEVYEFHISQSIFPDVQPGMEYFRVDTEMEIVPK